MVIDRIAGRDGDRTGVYRYRLTVHEPVPVSFFVIPFKSCSFNRASKVPPMTLLRAFMGYLSFISFQVGGTPAMGACGAGGAGSSPGNVILS